MDYSILQCDRECTKWHLMICTDMKNGALGYQTDLSSNNDQFWEHVACACFVFSSQYIHMSKNDNLI